MQKKYLCYSFENLSLRQTACLVFLSQTVEIIIQIIFFLHKNNQWILSGAYLQNYSS